MTTADAPTRQRAAPTPHPRAASIAARQSDQATLNNLIGVQTELGGWSEVALKAAADVRRVNRKLVITMTPTPEGLIVATVDPDGAAPGPGLVSLYAIYRVASLGCCTSCGQGLGKNDEPDQCDVCSDPFSPRWAAQRAAAELPYAERTAPAAVPVAEHDDAPLFTPRDKPKAATSGLDTFIMWVIGIPVVAIALYLVAIIGLTIWNFVAWIPTALGYIGIVGDSASGLANPATIPILICWAVGGLIVWGIMSALNFGPIAKLFCAVIAPVALSCIAVAYMFRLFTAPKR